MTVVADRLDAAAGDDGDRSAKRLLLVSWHFPPANAVAAIRLGKMARHLQDADYRLRVVTPDQDADDRSLPLEVDPSSIIRTGYVDLDGRLNPLSQRTRPEAPANAAKTKSAWPGPGALLRQGLARLYRDVVLYPDRRIDWSFTLIPALFRAIKAERPDLILVSGPPFSSFIGTAFAAWWFDIPWIVEFRDRWADDPYALTPVWRRRIDDAVERFLVKNATGITTVSDVWTYFYAGKYGLPTETVMNGFDPKDFELDIETDPGLPLRLLHAGTIYPGRRDPAALFEAIRRHEFHPDELRVQFNGHQLSAIEEQAERYDVSDFVDLRAAVPYGEAIALQKRSDILLLLQWNDPADEGNVPAKIFEYFATNRQILGLGPLNGVPAGLVRERKAGLFSNDPDEIAQKLKDWIAEKKRQGRVTPPARDAAAGLDRDGQYRRLDRFCRAVIDDDRERRQRATPKGRPAISATLKSPYFEKIDPGLIERPTLAVIIDTEADFDWQAPFSRDAHDTASVLHQSRAQRLFDRFGVKPTYLIDYPVATDPGASAVLRGFVDQGRADVGLQLHPWTNPPFSELLSSRNSYPSGLPKALQEAKIEQLIEAVRKNLRIEPKVFKSGRYGFNDDTADLLEMFGLEVDTSVVPFTDFSPVHGPNFLGCPHRPFWFGKNRALLELPVTRNLCGLLGANLGPSLLPLVQGKLGLACHLPGIFARLGLLDRLTLTPEGMDLADLKRLTRALIQRGERLFTFVFHSPSLASGNTPYVRNDEELQAFLGRIEAYLRFFTEELGGVGRSAIEIREQLLQQKKNPVNEPVTAPAFAPTFITTKKIIGKQPERVGPETITERPKGHGSIHRPLHSFDRETEDDTIGDSADPPLRHVGGR